MRDLIASLLVFLIIGMLCVIVLWILFGGFTNQLPCVSGMTC